ncbi:MAG: mechanosensitive ion channel [Desulfuromonadales bacterium]|nr:mechanosensitive ion channel [Desulfuromonadales bacterium]
MKNVLRFGRSFKLCLYSVCLFCWLMMALPIPLFAAEADAPATAAAPVVFPGLQEVVPRASKLTDDLTRMTSGIIANVNIDSLTEKSIKLDVEWQKLNKQIQSYGDLTTWPINRLLQAQGQIDQLNQEFSLLLNLVSEPLSAFEDIRIIWSTQKKYWNDWQKSLKESGATVPRATFRQVDEMLTKLLQGIVNSSTQLIQLQQRISQGRDGLLTLKEKLSTELVNLQREPLKRNAPPLLSQDFFEQFDQNLNKKTVEGLRATFQFQGDFINRMGWLIGLQFGLVFLLVWCFRALERLTADRTEEWEFVFARPIAAALFIAATLPQLLYTAPPQLLLLTMTSIAVFSAARLAAAIIVDNTERRFIYTLSVVYISLGLLNVTGTPLPYHRLYLTLLSLIGIPAILLAVQRQIRSGGQIDKIIVAMILSALVLLTVLIAELTGYVTLAEYLLEAAFGAILILLLVIMMLRIGEGGIEFIFTIKYIVGKQFVKQLDRQAPYRFKNLLRITIFISTLNYVLDAIGQKQGIDDLRQTLLSLEVNIGEFHLSLQMILLVILALYLTSITSWFIQSFIESQFFYNKRVDRGVRDAIKKLLHYALILIGFLIAMSMAGIELKNFTLLAGAFGIGIGFGLQDIVNNFVSGLILLFERPVKVGDTVIVGDTWGVIVNIGMRSTVVETFDLSELIVPNSQMISEKVTNWTLSNNVSRIVIPVGVKYGTDMRNVISILEQVANEYPEVAETPPPSAIFTEFGDSSLNFELRVWIADVKLRLLVRSNLGIAIAEALHAAGIEIPFPQRDLHLRSVEPGIIATDVKNRSDDVKNRSDDIKEG